MEKFRELPPAAKWLLLLAGAAVLALLLLWLLDRPQAAERVLPQPVIELARGEQCVEDPEIMRRYHQDFLRKQADDTVHGGVRAAKHSLTSCIECHASEVTRSVASANSDFCMSCHIFTGVEVNCFQCHAHRPSVTSFLPLSHPSHRNRNTMEQQLRDQLTAAAGQP